MRQWIFAILGSAYQRIPMNLRPYAKRAFLWGELRGRALLKQRRIHRGTRIEFLDFEIAHLEPVELLGPGPGEVLVEGGCSTVSPGTERAVLCGLPGSRRDFPYVPGYSMAGRVVAIGKGCRRFREGDRVVGRVHHASREVVAEAQLFPIPDRVDDADASFLELGVIALQGIRKARLRPGADIAVLGQGLIGQLCNRLARVAGAGRITAVAASAARAETALRPGGADAYVDLSSNESPKVAADVIVEAVGSPQAVVTSLSFAGPGARIVLVGSARGLGRDVDMQRLAQRKGVEIFGAHIGAVPDRDASPGRWTYEQEARLFLSLLASGRLNVSDLVTWRADPTSCNAVYEALAEGGRGHVAIQFDWGAARQAAAS